MVIATLGYFSVLAIFFHKRGMSNAKFGIKKNFCTYFWLFAVFEMSISRFRA